jgi:hypothetical protein
MMHERTRAANLMIVAVLTAGAYATPTAEAEPSAAEGADARAVKIATDVMERMGGRDAWSATRFVSWRFFGNRMHYWDRHTGDIRIVSPEGKDREGNRRPEVIVLMNIDSKQGRAWSDGEPVEQAGKLAELLDMGHQWWVNDAYWMFMPYKLLDPGVTLKYAGERAMEDGRQADVLDLTFDSVGYTPENRYEVFVARDTGLVEQWAFFSEASEQEPRFTLPWANWKQFGNIWLATSHGRDLDWKIAVHDTLPEPVFTDPNYSSP